MNNRYSGTTLPMVFQVDKIFTLHYFEYNKYFSFEGETHDFWEIVYIDSGTVGVTAENKKLYLKQGECIFHKPNEFHKIWTEDKFASSIIISFSSSSPCMELFNELTHTVTNKQRYLIHEILQIGKETYMGPLDVMEMEKLIHSPEISFGSEQMIKNLLEQLLIDIIRGRSKRHCSPVLQLSAPTGLFTDSPDPIVLSSHQELIQSILGILENNLYRRLSLEDIAGELNFSQSYIKNIFKRETGYTIMQFYFKLKIDKAKQLISEDQYTFTQISDLLGYDSIHSFSKAFRKATAMSPTEYKASVKNRSLL
ncbi:MAG: AraC family transcriptional regulator [Hungatella hathewayi]|uniref:helix-turn-helix domain-containing protein n=1 Tax=Hungatella TaxID=1649459 RepID=UPI001106409A|nr:MULTISPECIES: AraC family transcriptional regulator [Hungatella]MCI7380579.1 AraC family transcriptional regulator [Hungatella sp.]MDY6235573.1 AraC family transcriptional regulator [Hungatella hathewayi]